MATDDRYRDDVHYRGGCVTASELSQYAVSQVAMNALPPLPEAWGEGWRDAWRARLEETPVWLFEWARQQRDGPYWRQGSIAPDYGRIEAAILQLAGWADEYVDAALRIQARCTSAAARRTIVGPWVHGLPDHAYPGPNVDWLHELIRWFDRWLRDVPNGTEGEPAVTWFRREFTPPERFPTRLNGSWQATAAWPAPDAATRSFRLDGGEDAGRGRLVETTDLAGVDGEAGTTPDDAATTPADGGTDELPHRPTAGVHGGTLCWGAGHPPNGLAADLRVEEPNGLVYTSPPLGEPLDVLGAPVAVLHVAAHTPVAHVVARIGDVSPDGAVEQVSEGILNLAHRDAHAAPSPLEPGRIHEVRVPLRAAGYRFLPGHRVRLSLATAHWPVIWPAPGDAGLTVHRGPGRPSRLELPSAPTARDAVPTARDAVPTSVLAGPPPPLPEFGSEQSAPITWQVIEDPVAGTATVTTYEASTSTLPDGASTLFLSEALSMTTSEREPGTGRFANTCEYRLRRGGLDAFVVADGTTVAHAAAFEMTVHLRVELDGAPWFERSWGERIARDLL
jgi:putative CocE/NonD family hydrolase